ESYYKDIISDDDVSDLAEFINNIEKSSCVKMNNNPNKKRKHNSSSRNITTKIGSTKSETLNDSIIERRKPKPNLDLGWILDDDDKESFSSKLINLKNKDPKENEIFKFIDNLHNNEDMNLGNHLNIVKKLPKKFHIINGDYYNDDGDKENSEDSSSEDILIIELPSEIEESLKELCRMSKLTPEAHLEQLVGLFEKLYLEDIKRIENSSKLIGRVCYFLTELFKNVPKDVFLIKNFVEAQNILIDKICNIAINSQPKQNHNDLLKIILPDLLSELEKLLDLLMLKKNVTYY
ncbi:17269_t:CDS:2, partial [Entrophospora sp. SA101]